PLLLRSCIASAARAAPLGTRYHKGHPLGVGSGLSHQSGRGRGDLPGRRPAPAGGGALLLTSSVAALVGTRGRPTHAYAAMKGALLSLTRALAVSYGPDRIRVNAIVPGLIRTRLTADILDDPDRAGRAVAGIPLGFAGEPDDIAYAALYLASDEARFVTGATLVVDGGATAA
ncbi:MAG: SDR family oxidoreductase, partial [Chloroflexota bacterium]|nr:SDR family oxidoreductase [Chloroflexota bacterium]